MFINIVCSNLSNPKGMLNKFYSNKYLYIFECIIGMTEQMKFDVDEAGNNVFGRIERILIVKKKIVY